MRNLLRQRFFIVYILCISALLLIFCFAVPPFRKFDEIGHFQKVMLMTSGRFFCQKSSSSDYYDMLPKSLFDFINPFSIRLTEKFPISLYKKSYPYEPNKERVVKTDLCSLPFMGYIPQTIGAIMSFPFNNLLVTFYMARFFSGLFFMLCLLLSYRYIPQRYRMLLLLFAALPVVLHQVTIISYDATVLSLVMVIFALFTNYLDSKRITVWKSIIFFLLLFYLCAAKSGYFLLLLLPFFLIPKVVTPMNKKVFLCLLLFVFLFGFLFFVKYRISGLSDELYLKYTIIVEKPEYFLQLLYNSAWGMQKDILRGVFVSLGWHEYDLPLSVFCVYLIVSGAIGLYIIQREKKILSFVAALLLFLIILFSVVLIYLGFYLYLTPFGQSYVSGPQGRYFLPLIPFGIFALSQIIVSLGKRKAFFIGLCIASGFIVFGVADTVYSRYFDFAKLVSNGGEMETRINVIRGSIGLSHTVLLDKPFQQVYEVDPNSKIGGFVIVIMNQDQTTLSAPFEYFIKDETCKKTLVKGYLDQNRTKDGWVYPEYFKPVKHSEKKLCVEFFPLPMRHPKPYFSLLADENNIPILVFLYQSK